MIILSENTTRAQKIVVALFSVIFSLLVIAFVFSPNKNYLFILLAGFIFFVPAYFYTFIVFDISLDDRHIVVSNLLKTRRIRLDQFDCIDPAPRVIWTINSPYFSLVIKNGDRYNFIYEIPLAKRIKSNRKQIAAGLTNDILGFIHNIE